jgi:hypothetical protein
VDSESKAGQAAAAIDAWRESGAYRFDPVRFRFIEALARRSAAHSGDARRILDDKLARLLAAYGQDLERAQSEAAGERTQAARPEAQPVRGPLAELVAHIAQQAPMADGGAARGGVSMGLSRAPELKALGYFRSTWSKLSTDRRVTQSLATVPEKAGPLNSHQLVHRSLVLMRELSPVYLQHFVSYVDTLLWLEQANSAGPAAAPAARPEKGRKAGRGK